MRKYAPTDLIAHDPIWPYSDFEQKAYQMSAEFQHRHIRAVAVWLEDGAKLACTAFSRLACQSAGTFPAEFFTGKCSVGECPCGFVANRCGDSLFLGSVF